MACLLKVDVQRRQLLVATMVTYAPRDAEGSDRETIVPSAAQHTTRTTEPKLMRRYRGYEQEHLDDV